MKNIKHFTALLVALIFLGCQEEEPTLDRIIVPSNLSIATVVSTDGSGIVEFTAAADNAITYTFKFSDGETIVAANGKATKRFTLVGLNSYSYTVIAYGAGGVSSSDLYAVEVESDFSDFEALEFLTGGTLDEEGVVEVAASKKWYLAASEAAHLGVGATLAFLPDQFWFPGFFATTPFQRCEAEISSCFCDDELTFTLNASGNQLSYELNNNGSTFFNAGHQSIIGQDAGEDACFEFDTSGTSMVSLAPTSVDWSQVPDPAFNSRGTVMSFSDNAFMSYYVGSSSYEILEITDDFLYVRTIDANDSNLAWYLKFSTSSVEEQGNADKEVLIWSDEFDIDGAPNASNWGYDLGDGGWGNDELQTYTDDAENVIVEGGMLKITAKADGAGGYTSARLKSENLQEFAYGRVEVRAKLPAAQGTWPAIWMLGANFDTVGWPECGEIDIMEQTGADKSKTSGALHFPGNSAGNAPTQETDNAAATTAFHNYSVVWKEETIELAVDDTVFFSFDNTSSIPFNSDFFVLLNIAMGGTLGGTIDPAFTEDTMEIDYIRVYQ